MKKIIVIPADSITNNISRSYFFSKYLAENNIVYLLRWYDPQDLMFKNKKINKLATLKCFINSLFSKTKILKSEISNLNYLYTSRMLFMVIYRFLGVENALKISRFYNSIVLKSITRKIKPNVIFYADGFDGQPIIIGDWVNISDIQDDFDSNNFRNSKYQFNYGKNNFEKCDLNWVVSKKAAINLESYYKTNFTYLPNGVEINEMKEIDENQFKKLKEKYSEKYIVSYIGGEAWVDYNFSNKIFEELLKKDPSIHVIIVGNLKFSDSENVSYIGAVSKEESKLYYHLSDIGVMLKPSIGSNFLINSLPLKIIQYSILNKIFISPKIAWLEEERFNNVRLLDQYTPSKIVDEILKIKNSNQFHNTFDSKWMAYDWKNIVFKIEKSINQIQSTECK